MSFIKCLTELKRLKLPEGEYVIFGSGPLAVRKIRGTKDVDIIVKAGLWKKLSLKYKPGNGNVIHIGNIEVYKDWKPWLGSIGSLIESADMINGLPFVKLKFVLKWKKLFNREKDKRDIKLIKEFLKKK